MNISNIILLLPTVLFMTYLPICHGSGELAKARDGAKFADTLSNTGNAVQMMAFFATGSPLAMAFITGTVSTIKYILGIRGQSESQTLLAIKGVYNQMERRFDLVDQRLAEMEKQNNWNAVKNEYSSIQKHITEDTNNLKSIYEGPLAAKQNAINYFKGAYKSHCTGCALNVYNGMMGREGGFTTDILQTAKTSTNNDRPAMQKFMLGLFKLLVMAVNNELSYRQMMYSDADVNHQKTIWDVRLKDVVRRMKTIDKNIRDAYHQTADSDINDFARLNPKSTANNAKFSVDLYNFLKRKFDWRDWLVIVYDPVRDVEQKINQCDGFLKFNTHGRSIVVASVEQIKHPINTGHASTIIKGIKTRTHQCTPCHQIRCQSVMRCYWVDEYPLKLYSNLAAETKNCRTYASTGVIRTSGQVSYQGLSKRLVHIAPSTSNPVKFHMFG